MTSWIYIYKIVVIISWCLCSGSLMMKLLLVFLVIMTNVVISFIKEYRGSTLRPPCNVIDDVIVMKILFGIIWDDLFISEVKLKLCLVFQNFQNGRHFEPATNFFTESYTESWIYQKDSHEHFRHFELLIDAVAIIYQFQNLTYFVILWRHQWRHECVKHNLHN